MEGLLYALPKIVQAAKLEWECYERERKSSSYSPIEIFKQVIYPQHNNNSPIDKIPVKPEHLFIHGDNLTAMKQLLDPMDSNTPSLRGKIKLIYIDPPFDSKLDYFTPFKPPPNVSNNPNLSKRQLAYTDSWKQGTFSYLQMLCIRLFFMKELLHENGSIYVHIDWHVGHYVKLLLDEIFGRENFRNEIIWLRDAVGKGAKKTSRQWSRELESIYVYSKTSKMTFNQLYKTGEELTYTQLKEFRYKEPSGRKYKIVTLGDYSASSIANMHANQLIHTTKSGKKYKKYYLDEFRLAIGSLWNDIPNLSHGKNSERLPYETQKPIKLLERIIAASTEAGDIVADFFAGTCTTTIAADRLRRRSICCDLGEQALYVSTNRFLEQVHKPIMIHTLQEQRTFKKQNNPIIEACFAYFQAVIALNLQLHARAAAQSSDSFILIYVDEVEQEQLDTDIEKVRGKTNNAKPIYIVSGRIGSSLIQLISLYAQQGIYFYKLPLSYFNSYFNEYVDASKYLKKYFVLYAVPIVEFEWTKECNEEGYLRLVQCKWPPLPLESSTNKQPFQHTQGEGYIDYFSIDTQYEQVFHHRITITSSSLHNPIKLSLDEAAKKLAILVGDRFGQQWLFVYRLENGVLSHYPKTSIYV